MDAETDWIRLDQTVRDVHRRHAPAFISVGMGLLRLWLAISMATHTAVGGLPWTPWQHVSAKTSDIFLSCEPTMIYVTVVVCRVLSLSISEV
jgi:uncharacterized membrane protein YczE